MTSDLCTTRDVGKVPEGDIAVVGMACLFPAAPDLQTFWQNIVDKVDAISEPPEDWGGGYSFDPASSESDRIYCQRGGYLGELSRFDPLEHGIMPKAVDGAEPEHFLALRVASEALKDAGFPEIPINRERTEVILGRGTYVNRALTNLHQHGFVIHQTLMLLKALHPEYPDRMLAELKSKLRDKLPPFDALTAAGVVSSIMSGRIANRLDLKGANYCVDAACASSLIAVEHGVRDLRLGRCDAVIAGGVQLSGNNLVLMVFSQLGALSRRAAIRPFDADADGTLLGEGVGMVVLKRQEDAERDGNRIYANIKGVGSASDGRAKSIVAPRVEGEELALRRAYAAADVAPSTVGLIEAHGTSIPLGDATEIEALSRVFGPRDGRPARCALGSVKSMIGHLIPAAGIAGLIKGCLALYHRTLPPTLHYAKPDPRLGLEKTAFYINTQTRPWIHPLSGPARRRAGVSAFGFGGINAHAILEESTSTSELAAETYHRRWETELCVISGQSRQDLIAQTQSVHAFLSASPDVPLKDVAFTLNTRLSGKPSRLAVVCGSVEELSRKLDYALKRLSDPSRTLIRDASGIFFFEEPLATQGKTAFLFPGEGSQYVGMLADLCVHFPEVRRCFDLTDRAFLEADNCLTLSEVLFPPPTGLSDDDRQRHEERVWAMEEGVQAVTTANRAIHLLLGRLEIEPDMVLGHSSGEFGALEAAGAIRLDSDEEIVQYIRGGKRSVAGVSADADTLEEAVLVAASPDDPDVVSRIVAGSRGALLVAMDNCPYQIVICGSAPAAQRAIEQLHQAGVSCTTLPFRRPYHTPAFEAATRPLMEFFRSLKIASPKVPVYSCATAGLFPDAPEEVRALAVAQWTRPVRFRQTIEAMYQAGARVFVEVGPRGNLTSFVNDILRQRRVLAVPTNVQHRSGLTQLHHTLGLLAAQGVDVKLDYLYARRGPQLVEFDAPTSCAGKEAARRKMPRLSLALPIVYLDREDLQDLERQSASGESEPARRILPAAKTDARPEAAAPASPPPTTGRPASRSTRPSGDASSRRAAMKEHFRTMEQFCCQAMDTFLRSQQRLMSAYFKGAAQAADLPPLAVPPAAKNGSPAAAPHDAPPQSSPAVVAPRKLPFIGSIVRRVPGQEAVIRRDLDLSEDLFLRDHVLGGKVSFLDRTLEPLPVMPLTMSVEMIGEAAVCLVPGTVLVGMRAVRAHRWITFEDDRVRLEIVARRLNDREVEVQMREVDAGMAASGPPIIEGTMILADAYPQPPAAGEFHLEGARPSRFVPGNVYTTGMFNGPRVQAIVSIDQWAEGGSVATFRALPADRLFRSVPDPEFVTEPVLLDAAGQQAAHWNAEESSSGFNFFPYRFEEMRFYAPALAAGAEAQSRLRIERIGPGQYRSDIDLIGPDGRLRARLIGWEDREFPLPKAFYGIRHGSPDVEIGHEWPALLATIPSRHAFECRRVDEFSKELLLGHGKIWLEVLAHQVLSRRERAVWQAASMSDPRRVQWLLGRAAAKEAVRRLLARRHGLTLCPADIDIDTDENGRPCVLGGLIPNLERTPTISIAHTGETAVALAADADEAAGVGIDVERVRALEEGFVDMTFRPEEQTLLSRTGGDHADELVLRLWCAKEAVAKALGTGLRGQPRNYVVRGYSTYDGTAELEIPPKADRSEPPSASDRVRAHTIVDDSLVASIAVYGRR